jgi:hypothetical protein
VVATGRIVGRTGLATAVRAQSVTSFVRVSERLGNPT